jgi:hypothetical protein
MSPSFDVKIPRQAKCRIAWSTETDFWNFELYRTPSGRYFIRVFFCDPATWNNKPRGTLELTPREARRLLILQTVPELETES